MYSIKPAQGSQRNQLTFGKADYIPKIKAHCSLSHFTAKLHSLPYPKHHLKYIDPKLDRVYLSDHSKLSLPLLEISDLEITYIAQLKRRQ